MGEDSETVDGGRSSGSEPQRPRRDPKMIGLVVLLVVGVLAAVTAVLLSGGDEAAAPGDTAADVTDPPTDSTPPTEPADDLDDGAGLDGSAIGPGEVLLEPVSVPMVNAFSTSVSTTADSALTLELPELPIPTTSAPLEQGQVALAQVAGNEPGLYGGTRDVDACDSLQLTEFLEDNADKGEAWAEVQGIEPADIREFMERLTPVNLTRDTRVTNHGFVDGKAAAHQSVLQAGHSVFVDDFGVPRAKCSCGNPLAPPEPLTSAPTYVGDRWPGFDTTTIIVVIATVPVEGGFEVVDIETGEIITVPIGGFPDPVGEQTDDDQSADGESVEGPGEVDGDLAVDLVNVGNIMGVTPGASSAATFTVDEPTLITSVRNYHYGPETPPGQVGLTNSDGAFYGPWQTVGTEGQGGVADAYWTATPYVVIPAGTYTVWDSEPSTWSTNADAGGIGFTVVQGVVGVLEPPDDPGTMPGDVTPPATTEGPEIGRGDPEWSPAIAAAQTLDLLLLDCGVEYDPTFIDGGGDENGWRWMVETPDGTADFFVGFIDGPDNWYVDANNALANSLAGRCGFLEVG